jgi:NRPS condensation-like uncharacterized protein
MKIPDKFKVTTQDAYNYAASKVFSDQQLCMVIKLNGTIDENTIAKAVRLTLDFEPVLGCRFVENKGSPYWERRDDLDQIRTCSLVETAVPEKAIQTFINQAIHADVDPLVSSKIFREKEADTVCIKVNHSVCDAGGLKDYVAILSNVHSTLSANLEYPIQPNYGRRDQTQIFEHTRDPKIIMPRGFPRPTWALPQTAGNEPLHSFRVISRGQFVAIKKYAHNKKATINDVLLTALYRTLFDLNNTAEGNPMTNQVSIDLRRYCPNQRAEAICNLSGALYTSLERKLGEAFGETLQRVCALMIKLKEDYPGIESAAGLEYLFSQGYTGLEKYLAESATLGRKYNVTFPLLSNFGVLCDYRFGGLHVLKGYLTSPIIYPPGFMLGTSTFNEEMTLSIGYCGQENTKQIKRFLDAYISELPN